MSIRLSWMLPVLAVIAVGASPAMAAQKTDTGVARQVKQGERKPSKEEEIPLPEAWQLKMDEIERHELGKADAKYAAGQFKEAMPLYEAYANAYAKSPAVAYAILRKGRCMQRLLKRKEAIVMLQEILEYFPNTIEMAAPALFYQGQCYFDNGDDANAVKVWAGIARDDGYKVQPIAAFAINQLGDYLVSDNKPDQAVPYWWQVALDFRTQNPKAALYAINQVVWYYIKVSPDEGKLREFWAKCAGWDERRVKLADDLATDREYWGRVIQAVRTHARFEATEASKRTACLKYWSAQTEGKFADWDDFQLAGAEFLRSADPSDAGKPAWVARLDQIFEGGKKDADRTIRWMSMMADNSEKAKAQTYYQKLDVKKLTYQQQRAVAAILYGPLAEPDLGRFVIMAIDLGKLDDNEKESLAKWLWKLRPPDGDTGMMVNTLISDVPRRTFNLLGWYESCAKDPKYVDLVVETADSLRTSETYAKKAIMIKAGVLDKAKRFDEAIVAYRAADEPPKTIFAIAECLVKSNRLEPAIQELRDLEALYPTAKGKAAQTIASYLLKAGPARLQEARKELDRIMITYPKTGESSWAHEQLEAHNFKVKGGTDAE